MRKIALLVVLILSTVWGMAQTRTVAGVVKDKDGRPVEGASIVIKGTKQGTAADPDGSFKTSAKAGDVLVITAVNCDPIEVTVGDQPTLSIILERKSGVINEVVVTALGIKRNKNTLPYAAQQVKGDEVSKTRNSNFVSNLSGKVSGLEIRQNNSLGGSTNVIIRGNKSIGGNNQALFVIDGVPVDNSNTNSSDQKIGRGGYDYGNAAADINPDDIESVNVLKGAAASALYGARASNGVVLITTKKNARGLGITVNSGVTTGAIDKSTFTKFQKSYGAGYGAYYGPNEDSYFNQADVNGDGVADLIVPTTEDASYGAKFDPNLLVYQWNAFDKSSPYYGKATPWVAAANDPTTFFENPVSFNNSIFVDGGGDKGYFKLGYTRNDDKGILPNSQIVKDLFNFGSSYKLSDKLTAAASVNFSKISGRGRYGTGYDSKNLMTNFRQWWQTNVDIQEQKDAYLRTGKNITWNWADPLADELSPIYWDNPYWTRYENYENDQRFRTLGNVSLNYKVTSYLNILGRVSVDSYDEMQEERSAVGSIDPSQYSRFNRTFREYNYDLLATFEKDLNKNFNLKALGGVNIRRTNTKSVLASTNGGLYIPKLYSLSNSINAIEAPKELAQQIGVDGYFTGATLTYNQFLILDATLRRDQASTLPEDNNAYYYPAVSGGFVFSRLLTSLNWLSFGKLRANYAQVYSGGEAFAALTDVYDKPSPFGATTLFSITGTKNNPELKPEKSKSYEFGVEASVLKSRAGFDITYYHTNTVDQILPVAVSNATGYTYKYVNSGSVVNRGVEVSVYGIPVKTKNFSWTVNANWSRNRNKVVELYEGSDNMVLASYQGGVTINATKGQPFGTIRGSNFVYTDGQKTVSATGRYLISSTSNEVIGNSNPDWIGGLTNTLRYKEFTFGFLIDVRQGGDVFSLDQYYGLATGVSEATVFNNDLGNPVRNTLTDGGGIVLDGVTEESKPNTVRASASNYGAFGYRYNPAAAFVYDASYVKLREATITYSIPANVISKINPVKGIDFSLVGRNLWIIHKNLPYADPEEGISSGNAQGYQGGAYPTTRQIGFNVKLRFYNFITNMKKLIISSSFLVLLASCTKHIEDMNVEQKSATAVPSQALFANAERNFSDAMASSNVNLNIFRLITQQWQETTYTDESNYDLSTRGIAQRWWAAIYRDVLMDLAEAKKVIATEETAENVKASQLAVVDIMQAQAFYVLINTFGDLPYNEAFDFNNLFPKYDDAKTVYYQLLTNLDADIAALNNGTNLGKFADGDLLFSGNIDAWKNYANSLKFKMGMLIADADPAKAKEIVEAAALHTFSSNADNAVFHYFASTPNTNPIWVDLVQSGRHDFVACRTATDMMNSLNDPRRQYFFTDTAGSGLYAGGKPGASSSYTTFSHPGNMIVEPDFEAVLLDYSEVEFLKAEAVERGFNVGGTAEEHYNNAVTASVTYWGGSDADAAAYLNNPDVDYTTAKGSYKEKIGTQKWLALYNRGFDAWTEVRRLDYPALVAPSTALSGFPVRFTYPVNEQNLNKSNYDAASVAIGGDKVETKLFWDKF